jgi:hypothetical protein
VFVDSAHLLSFRSSSYQLALMGKTMSSLSTAEQVKSAANAPGVLFLDVRNDAEVEESRLTSRPFLHVSCTPDDCSELTARAEELLPDKNGTYCVMRFSFHFPGRIVLGLLQIAHPPLIRLLLFFSYSLNCSAGNFILQIRSSCGQSEGDLGAVGIHKCAECRWPRGSYK